MRKFTSLPTLGGRLAILNMLLWVPLIYLGQRDMLPGAIILAAGIALSVPLVTCFLIPSTTSNGPNEAEIILLTILIVLNSFVWGYGLSWIWQRLMRFWKKEQP